MLGKIAVELGRMVRFGFVGTIAAATYAAVTFAIAELRIADPVVASVIGYFCAALISYFGHLYYSFRVTPDHRTFLWRFAITVVVTSGMTVGCTWLMTEYWSYPAWAAVLAVTLLIPATNYVCGRFWVFLPKPIE